jgi:predicted molibdopterin-dependent oxidoreductase YjgC
MRIEEHPILGQFEKGPRIQFTFDGKAMEGFEGEPIAIALRSSGVMIHRYTSRRNEPRGMFCAIGRCTDCIMVVNGRPNIRTCVEPLKAGMVVETQSGKGPSGEGAR